MCRLVRGGLNGRRPRCYSLGVLTRATLAIAAATFLVTSVIAIVLLGTAFQSETCGAGWTGYAPIGTCVKTFWSTAYFVGPAIGLVVSANVAWRRWATGR